MRPLNALSTRLRELRDAEDWRRCERRHRGRRSARSRRCWRRRICRTSPVSCAPAPPVEGRERRPRRSGILAALQERRRRAQARRDEQAPLVAAEQAVRAGSRGAVRVGRGAGPVHRLGRPPRR
jgi:hypothetical protein